MNTRHDLPEGVKPYASSAVFTSTSVPKNLLNAHATKDGVWGRLNILEGTVQYFLQGQSEPLAILHKNDSWIIFPTELHFIQPSKEAEFQIEFCR